jgi:hypothetical protein
LAYDEYYFSKVTLTLLLFKLITVPFFILIITLAGKRWGSEIAGTLGGFPVVAGPIVFFLTLEQGVDFGLQASISAMYGTVGILVFGLAYGWACKYWHEKEIRRQLREEMKSNLLKKSSSQEQRNNDKILDSQYFESDSSKERETNNSSKERETNSDNECIITPKSKSSIPSKSSTLSPIVVSADKSSGSLVKSKNKKSK